MATQTTQPETPTRPPRRRRRGVTPWFSNEHGAWAMLITPAVLGTVAGVVTWLRTDPGPAGLIAIVAVLCAWFTGYGAFFAFGLAARARTPQRRRKYLTPVYVYGALSAAALLGALAAVPAVAWWALPYAPLLLIAVGETLRGRGRSLLSGLSTTVAAALLVPVLMNLGAGEGLMVRDTGYDPAPAWTAMIFLALYFSSTVPFVKSMIRERANRAFLNFSLGYHLAVVGAVAGLVWFGPVGPFSGAVLLATVLLALGRAMWFPATAARGRKWTAKHIGMAEMPLVLLASLGVLSLLL
ncbi:MAG TPA: YwiC-like family protein [Corynebacterium sp.]|nr:YwiC-like family protein [Corynebacterium sp.]